VKRGAQNGMEKIRHDRVVWKGQKPSKSMTE